MIKCDRCWFGHKTAEEYHACNNPHEFIPSDKQTGICAACGHAKVDAQHDRYEQAQAALTKEQAQ